MCIRDRYTNSQPAANTAANPILFSQEGFQSRLTNMAFRGGSYAIKVASGISRPWGNVWDRLQCGSELTLGAMDWSAGLNATPNNTSLLYKSDASD